MNRSDSSISSISSPPAATSCSCEEELKFILQQMTRLLNPVTQKVGVHSMQRRRQSDEGKIILSRYFLYLIAVCACENDMICNRDTSLIQRPSGPSHPLHPPHTHTPLSAITQSEYDCPPVGGSGHLWDIRWRLRPVLHPQSLLQWWHM